MSDVLVLDIPNSSNIDKLTYTITTRDLQISFKSGIDYVYKEVPMDVVNSFATAESAGKFFNKEVRNSYACTRVPE